MPFKPRYFTYFSMAFLPSLSICLPCNGNWYKFPGCQCQATRMTPFFFLDPSGLCCIASYDGLKIKKMENISSLLFWYL
ncbi:hypothetical protein [Wolbachia endosymbiont (group A) of Alloplasta piceator]|uniref:hypothetical protein n=1 Tax=Wolbachia endosymbiont (group A) of Alloplasta piceator TaxID=3066188 RepID=UPI003340251B